MRRVKKSGKKRILTVILLVVLVMGTALGATLAFYHTKTDKIENKFSVGNVTTELVEDFYQNTDSEFTKTPKVTNTGADSCLVRLQMTVTPEEIAEKMSTDADGNPAAYLVIRGWSDKWILNKSDGFFYYSEALKPGESTEPLFTSVTVNYNDENPWIDFDIILYQEAVQAEVVSGGKTITDPDAIWDAYKNLK